MASIKNVLFVIAMEAEAEPFVAHLNLKKDEKSVVGPALPGSSFSGTHDGCNITVVCNGKCPEFGVDSVGTVSAALTTHQAITVVKPDLVINAGTAGGFKAMGGSIGDVYVSSHFKNHDRRIPLPGFDEFGRGTITAPSCSKLVAALNLKTGVVSSGNSLDCTPEDAAQLKTNEACIKEMEAAAIAYVCQRHTVPCIGIKSITDIVDGDRTTGEEFMENLAAAAKSLQETLPKVVSFVAGKTMADL